MGYAGSVITVSEGLGQCQSPSIVCGSDTTLHVVWRNNVTGIWEIYYRSFQSGTFTPVQQLSRLTSNALTPVMAIDAHACLHIAWSVELDGNYEIVYITIDTAGNASEALNISTDQKLSTQPSILVDTLGMVHVAWRNGMERDEDIFYRTCQKGIWSAVYNLSHLIGVSCTPDIALTHRGNPAVVWSDDSYGSWNIYLREFLKGTWRGRKEVYAGHHDGRAPVVCNDNENLHIAWVQATKMRTDIYYRTYNARGWSVVRNVSSSEAVSEMPRLAVGPAGTIHAVWEEQLLEQHTLWYGKQSAGKWHQAEQIMIPHNVEPSNADIAVGIDGAVWCTWRDKHEGRWRVYLQRLDK